MADPDLELKIGSGGGGGWKGGGFVLLALPAFLPSVISSLPKIRGPGPLS